MMHTKQKQLFLLIDTWLWWKPFIVSVDGKSLHWRLLLTFRTAGHELRETHRAADFIQAALILALLQNLIPNANAFHLHTNVRTRKRFCVDLAGG